MSVAQRRACVDEWSHRHLGLALVPASSSSSSSSSGLRVQRVSTAAPAPAAAGSDGAPNRPTHGELAALLVLSVVIYFTQPAERDACVALRFVCVFFLLDWLLTVYSCLCTYLL
jgi:hypothetical protein